MLGDQDKIQIFGIFPSHVLFIVVFRLNYFMNEDNGNYECKYLIKPIRQWTYVTDVIRKKHLWNDSA